MLRFSTTLQKVGVNPCVRVPIRVSRAFNTRGYVPVHVHLEHGVVASTLVPIGNGTHRLYINAAMLRFTNARVGKKITLGLDFDGQDRTLNDPEDILSLLRTNALAAKRWKSLTPSKRKEVIRYISFAKTPETRGRNIAKLYSILTSRAGSGVLAGIRIAAKGNEG